MRETLPSVQISVIVPFHNAERYIRHSIDALLASASRVDRCEIIMVDSNSTDRSADIVRSVPQIRLLSESKTGPYAARNRGVAESRGAILAFTDADCAPDRRWLEAIAAAMERPDVQFVQGPQQFAGRSRGLSVLSDYEQAKNDYIFSRGEPEIYYACANNMAVRRSAFDRVGPFVEMQRGADVIFIHRLLGEFSTDAVRYRADMSVTHLEITSVPVWLEKLRIYGRSARGYMRVAKSRPLNNRERLAVCRATIERGNYSTAKSLLLVGLLAAAGVSYELGRRFAWLARVWATVRRRW